ncbi:MAG: trypsin-like peptidase domain-containing protein [Balneolaceae bacterium]|nr:trypsin-like peptidase domain-containing protein [Balneolaceae bacterium]
MYRSYRLIPILFTALLLAAGSSCERSGGSSPGNGRDQAGEPSAGQVDTPGTQPADPGAEPDRAADTRSREGSGDTLDTWKKQYSQKYSQFQVDSTVYASRDNAITRAVREASPAIVSITATSQVQRRLPGDEFFTPFFFSQPQDYSSMGSGFIISEDGMVVTNDHVVGEPNSEITVSLPDGSQFEAEVIGTDELSDLALLQIRADRGFPYIQFGDSDELMVGQWAVAMGNPFGLFKSAQPSVTVGVISALNRDFRPNPQDPRVYMDMIQTDAAINRGNSGGPLVDSEGDVIGVNTLIYTEGPGGGNVGLGFAIPSNQVIATIDQLLTQGEVEMPFDPGFEMSEMTMELAVENNLPAVSGLLVTSVNRDGPAFEGGIMPGDIIVRIGEERVKQERHARALYRRYAEGDTMRVELLRNSRLYEAKMVLRKKVIEGSGN